ncbi:MAG: YebC/PmpR family DNA-binding transcriptional regulator [Phycisphaeraceae bacterium]
MSGHSRWANIKHKKAKSDAKRGKLWSKCVRAVMAGARQGGGDPATNLTLRYAIDEAKAANVPKDTIEKAIAKATGAAEGQNFEAVTYEGYGPGGVAIFVEALTDNRNRTAGDVRTYFGKHGGNLGASNSVAYQFQPRGVFAVSKETVEEEKLMEVALDAGAEDVTDEGEVWQIVTEVAKFMQVRQALEQAGIKPEHAELTRIADNTITLGAEDAKKVLALIEALEDLDDVQKVHANYDIPDEVMAAMEG